MKKLLLVFIDLDEVYLTALERKFAIELGEFTDISIITDMCYFSEYFSIPREIDILAINEQLYDPQLCNHNIGMTNILTEIPVENNQENIQKNINYIYKYTSVQEIFTQISSNEIIRNMKVNALANNSKIILLNSPIGDIGTTSIGLAMATIIKNMGYKVLFVSAENLQSFAYLLGNNIYLSNEVLEKFEKQELTYDDIKQDIIQDIVDYLPPFSSSLCSLNIKEEKYFDLIKNIKLSGEYNYIFIDTSSNFSKDIDKFINEVDKVIVMTNQYRSSCYKLGVFMSSINNVGMDKLLLICNKYNENKDNSLINYNGMFYISDYIYYDENILDATLQEIINSSDVMRISQYLLNI